MPGPVSKRSSVILTLRYTRLSFGKGRITNMMCNERSNWMQMVLSLSINSGGFGVTPNYASRDPAFYAVTARCLA